MDGLEVRELIVVGIDADAEEETGVSPVDDLVVPELYIWQVGRELGESRGQMAGVGRSAAIPSSVVWTHLDKVGLILLVSRGYEPVYFAA